ncbi:hypothetical protein TRVL_07230 [Trypanosoma vivax]|nr:hypothetical protein TRVL_07230 [Trypanosoma vivax]
MRAKVLTATNARAAPYACGYGTTQQSLQPNAEEQQLFIRCIALSARLLYLSSENISAKETETTETCARQRRSAKQYAHKTAVPPLGNKVVTEANNSTHAGTKVFCYSYSCRHNAYVFSPLLSQSRSVYRHLRNGHSSLQLKRRLLASL